MPQSGELHVTLKILNLEKWDDDVKDSIAEADKQLRDKCHEHKIRLRDEGQCRQQ